MFNKQQFKNVLLSINDVIEGHKENNQIINIANQTYLEVSLTNEVDAIVHNATVESEQRANNAYRRGKQDALDEGLKTHTDLMRDERNKYEQIIHDMLWAEIRNGSTAKFWVERFKALAKEKEYPLIPVVKEVRAKYGLGLKSAKEYVDWLVKEHNLRDQPAPSSGPKECSDE